MPARIAVVIPFYQSEPGILGRAIRSAAAQQGDLHLHVLVVDDGSPVPAQDELAGLDTRAFARLEVFRRENGGPAAARNTALERVPDGTDFVAFLDSDDEWTPTHLACAVRALGEDRDFYFSNFYQLNQTVGAFERAGRLDPDAHVRLDGSDHLFAYQGDLFDQVLSGNVIGTPTVVYRWAVLHDQRFRADFVFAGEDYLFWMDVARRTERVVFSTACEVVCGRGVNVYTGSVWGTPHSLDRIVHETGYKAAIKQLYELTAAQRARVDASISELRVAFVRDVLHRLRNRRPVAWQLLRRQWRADPASITRFASIALALAARRGS